ncbi:MAG: P1 family peptidase [Syntrophaceae bacterium]|nr:P1 family peptidase [Syntrophaceae bacterium]
MRVTLAYNLRRKNDETQAELLSEDDVDRLLTALRQLGYQVMPVEVSGSPHQMIDRLLESKPDLIFNVAEGTDGPMREAIYPAIYTLLGLPFTGGGSSLLLVDLNKRLSEKILDIQGIPVPKGRLITPRKRKLPENLTYPLIVKPNFEGSGMGIHQESVVHTPEEAGKLIKQLLEIYPNGLCVEEFVSGRELTVPMLELWPGHLLEIVEHVFTGEAGYNIYDYERKKSGESEGTVQVISPPELTLQERDNVLAVADKVFRVMSCPDFGRVDIRLHENGTPYFIEINALPRLQPDASMIISAKAKGLDYEEVVDLIVRSAARRYDIPLGGKRSLVAKVGKSRPPCRDFGISIGRLEPGPWNAITDVDGVHVGHVTHIRDDIPVDKDGTKKTSIRTGITAIVPHTEALFYNHLVAGGFVLNGIGEMSGLTQAIEWGWLETPILLTNTMSVGLVHTGIIHYMIAAHPELGREVDVIIPLVGETNDAFLNDVQILANTSEEAIKAIQKAQSGPVEQGSVGGGTGMISFDFAGGIGTASRVLPKELGSYTIGVLVQSNFGKMRNLTIDGAVIGRQLDPLYPLEGRRGTTYGSVIVVVATDAPLLSVQLSKIAKRAALGLGRVGSYAATTSGEIIFAFSTGNRFSRKAKELVSTLNLTFVSETHINLLYEAVIEATEEAVLNAIFCSGGMTGRLDRSAPPLPADIVTEILNGRRSKKVD